MNIVIIARDWIDLLGMPVSTLKQQVERDLAGCPHSTFTECQDWFLYSLDANRHEQFFFAMEHWFRGLFWMALTGPLLMVWLPIMALIVVNAPDFAMPQASTSSSD